MKLSSFNSPAGERMLVGVIIIIAAIGFLLTMVILARHGRPPAGRGPRASSSKAVPAPAPAPDVEKWRRNPIYTNPAWVPSTPRIREPTSAPVDAELTATAWQLRIANRNAYAWPSGEAIIYLDAGFLGTFYTCSFGTVQPGAVLRINWGDFSQMNGRRFSYSQYKPAAILLKVDGRATEAFIP